jgi:hypothetical protein
MKLLHRINLSLKHFHRSVGITTVHRTLSFLTSRIFLLLLADGESDEEKEKSELGEHVELVDQQKKGKERWRKEDAGHSKKKAFYSARLALFWSTKDSCFRAFLFLVLRL